MSKANKAHAIVTVAAVYFVVTILSLTLSS